MYLLAYDILILMNKSKKNTKVLVEEVLEYFPNGNVKLKGKLVDKAKNGEWEEYYENGNLKRSVSYSDGVKDGRTLVFKENGDLDFFMDYKKGKLLISPKFKRIIGKKGLQ